MGIDIRWENEDGKLIESLDDPYGLLSKVLPPPNDLSWTCLRFIDPYGSTIFNQIQIPVVVRELERARENIKDPTVI